ncbi:hypothetical protein niasHS_000382 [Heterodera schachtii]|uniref:Uncharacterized protein n=1 Tax=Heterodera schachtii TaxID=97005 RepID=A0ABD2K212_HETSC
MELLSKEEEESLKRLKRKLEHQLMRVQQSLTESEKWKSGTSDDDPVGPQEWEENEEETTKKGEEMKKKEEEEKKGREEKEKETEKKKVEMKQKDETETKRSLSVGTTKDDEISIVDSEERERDSKTHRSRQTNEWHFGSRL